MKQSNQEHDHLFFETNLLSLLRDVGRNLAIEIEVIINNL